MPTRDSQEFNAPDADIIFQSSDGVRFHIHAMNLRVSSGGFPPVPPKAGTQVGVGLSVDEVVPLPESSNVLEVLFAFMYPRRHPDLEDKVFDEVAEIAEAAEKYEVYPAMNTCRKKMRDFVETHPVQVALYGARHDYLDIIKETAPYAASLPLTKVVPLLPSRLILPWMEYQQAWDKARDAFLYFTSRGHSVIQSETSEHCRGSNEVWVTLVSEIVSRYRKAVKTSSSNPLHDLDSLFSPPVKFTGEYRQACCESAWRFWKEAIVSEKRKIPEFADFISRHTRL